MKIAILLLVCGLVLVGFDAGAQSNVYSFSVHTRWTIGNHPSKFGLEGFRRDNLGYYFSNGDAQTNSNPREHTAVIIGSTGFTLPYPVWPVAIASATAFVALIYLLVIVVLRTRKRDRISPISVDSDSQSPISDE